jgi:hypothetical protein
VLAGASGFVRPPDPTTLVIATRPVDGLAPGADVGLLGLDLTNRRRNRANGTVTAVTNMASPSPCARASATARNISRPARPPRASPARAPPNALPHSTTRPAG